MKYTLKSGEQFIVDGYTSNGEHKILNVLDTNTDDVATMKVVSHTKLQYLKYSSRLSPGTFYRIIDYQCTTSQEDTLIGVGQFDIVIQAISESELSEKGYAVHHDGDTYFSGCDVEAWEINYSIENDKSKYLWANDELYAFVFNTNPDYEWYIRYPSRDTTYNGRQYYAWCCSTASYNTWEGLTSSGGDTFSLYNSGIYTNYNYTKYTDTLDFHTGDDIDIYDRNFSYDNDDTVYVIPKGRGVIYWMKDEYGNECPYDFKHLRFTDPNSGDLAWTFNNSIESEENSIDLPTTEITNAKIWVDQFWDESDSEPGDYEWQPDATEAQIDEDYTKNNLGYKIYDYTGNSITYDGETLYIWRISADSSDYAYYATNRKGYAFTTGLDYSNITVMDQVSIYAFGSSEDSNDFVYEFGGDDIKDGYLIYHGTYSVDEVPNLESIVNDLDEIDAEINIDAFVDSYGEWTVDGYDGPGDLVNAEEDGVGYYSFTHTCVQYEGRILFLWQNKDLDFTIFTTGLDYSGYTAVDQIYPVFAFGNEEGAVFYDQINTQNNKSLRKIIVSASYSGPSIPKGNLISAGPPPVSQNLSSSIQNNKIPAKYNSSGIQVLDLTQIYYGAKNGSPYTKGEVDEAHEVIARALNEQKEILDRTIPFPEIVEVEHVTSSVTQELDPWKYYVFGEVSSLEVSFSEETTEYTPIYRFIFTALGTDTQLILPQECSLAFGHSLVMVEGKSYEIEIINNIVRVISATLE